MGKNIDVRIKRISENIKKYSGEMIKEKVMEGSEKITSSISPFKKANWVKDAMERLELLVDEETRIRIMENCSCESESNVKKGNLLYKKAKDIDAFLADLEIARIVGTRFERKGDIIYVYYHRCYCPLVNETKDKVTLTYCYCSQGYTKKMFEGMLERPVRVQLLQSVIHGDPECKFAVYL